MSKQRRQYSSAYKFKLALEAAKGSKTLAQLSSDTGVHPNQLSQWKAQLLDGGAHLYQRNPAQFVRELQQPAAELYQQIGRLKIELEWLKKSVLSRLRPSVPCSRPTIPRSVYGASVNCSDWRARHTTISRRARAHSICACCACWLSSISRRRSMAGPN